MIFEAFLQYFTYVVTQFNWIPQLYRRIGKFYPISKSYNLIFKRLDRKRNTLKIILPENRIVTKNSTADS